MVFKRGIILIMVLLLLVGSVAATDLDQVATYAEQYEDGSLDYLKFKTYLYSVEEQFYDEMEDQMERVEIDYDDSKSDEINEEIVGLGKQAEDAFFDQDKNELQDVVNSLITLFEELGDDYAVEVLENIYAAAEEEDWDKIGSLAMKLPKMGSDEDHSEHFEGYSQEFVEDMFGEPSGYEHEIWVMNDDEPIRPDDPVPFYQKSLYKGSKVKITLNAWPSAISNNGEIILFYHIGIDSRLTQEGESVDIDEVIDYIKDRTEAYQDGDISLKELAVEAAQIESKVHNYLADNEEDCDDVFSGLLSRKEESELTYFEGTLVDNNDFFAKIGVENRIWENEEGEEENNFNFWSHIENREHNGDNFNYEYKESEPIDTWGKSGEELWEEFSDGFVELMRDTKDANSAKEAHKVFYSGQDTLYQFLHEATWRAVSGESDMTTDDIRQGFLDLLNQEADDVVKETADRTEYKEYLIRETVQETYSWCRGEEEIECDHGYYCEEAACVSAEGGSEICDNGKDDDDDTYWDCEDPDCDCSQVEETGGWFSGDGNQEDWNEEDQADWEEDWNEDNEDWNEEDNGDWQEDWNEDEGENQCHDCASYCGEREGQRLHATDCVNDQCECYYEDIEEEEYEEHNEPVNEEQSEGETDPGQEGVEEETGPEQEEVEEQQPEQEAEPEQEVEEPEPEPVSEPEPEREPEPEPEPEPEKEEEPEPAEEPKEGNVEGLGLQMITGMAVTEVDWFSDIEEDVDFEEWTNPCEDECEDCWDCDWENDNEQCNEYCRTCNLCEYEEGNFQCYDNQYFNEEWAFCDCDDGYSDCDGDWINGCELNGPCEGCQSDGDCAEARCSDDRRRITTFTCEQGEGWEQDKNVLEIAASCNLYSGGRTETHFWIGGWGEDLDEFDMYKQEEHKDNNENWCQQDLNSLIEERLMIQESFNEEYIEWFFNQFVGDDPTKFEEHMRIIHSLHRILMENTDRTAWAISCLGEEEFPDEYQPIEISYESSFGNIEIWEEFKKTDHFGDEKINVLNPYMKMWIFPPKEFILEKMNEEMDGPKGPPAHEIEDIKEDEEIMDKINKISDRFGGSAEIIFQIEDGGEVVFQGLMEINPDIIMKIERVESYDGERDATMSVEFDFLYDIMSTVAKEVEGEHVEGPWWEDHNKHNGGMVQDGWIAIKIISQVIVGLTNGDIEVDPSDKLSDIVLSLKDIVGMMSMGE